MPRQAQAPEPPYPPGGDDSDLLAALLNGMDAALCAFDAGGTVTHWNREAERILGWTAEEVVGRGGLAGWAVRAADADDVQERLMAAMETDGCQVEEFALLTKGGGRVLVRTQCSAVPGADGVPAGVYCAFSEVHSRIDLERSLALSQALLEDASWSVVLVDADLRPVVVNRNAARVLGTGRRTPLGRPLGELVEQGLEELEAALQHVLAEGPPATPTELWLTLRESGGALGAGGCPTVRRCLRSGFLRLGAPTAEEPAPLGVAWIFLDVTDAKRREQENSRLRFRGTQLYRAARAAAECEDPAEAASLHLDFALAGFADHALVDLVLEPASAGERAVQGTQRTFGFYGGLGIPGSAGGPLGGDQGRIRLVRAAATPAAALGPCPPIAPGGIPVAYDDAHPAVQAAERCGSVRTSSARMGGAGAAQWATARKWPEGTVHGLCSALRSRGRTLGVVTFLRGASRRPFDQADVAYAEDVAVRVAAAVDLARQTRWRA
ncbi:PAS domain-containing protein [Streptomyces sp. B1866]|uniref:PAS domain-containing protein n=1 Tax=Streptomyces sp. B1866 TaxID=3075431 RepID=UPI0028909B16|nr:PAS domain-containing protein [Streptomyces sp. B1866]MDT3397293.1 PAS domain-containing protein [Streptomyces sp. B1866]